MYNIKALEEEWKRYRRKQRKPWIFFGLFLLFSGIGIVTYLNNDFVSAILNKVQEKKSIKKEESPPVKENTYVYYIDKPLTVLAEKAVNIAADNPMDNDLIEEDKAKIEESNEKNIKPRKKLHIQVIDTRKKSAYKEVEKRFRLGHDPDDSLFLAKAYYAKKQYKKAEYWALQTNKINDGIEESWLIFAKAKAKRGQRNEAKRILRTYIKKTNSSEAKVLLEKIQKGRI